jgi:shikimate kinase
VKERLVLVGFMGSGKSTVGSLVAQALGFEFRDMDAWIEARAGLSLPQIFAERGEDGFRAEELALAREIQGLPRLVVAAGGGAFTQPETRAALASGAFTVFLRCDLATALQRIRFDGSRPLAVSRERIGALFAERQPSYRLADFEVNAAAPPEAVAREIVKAFLGEGAAR